MSSSAFLYVDTKRAAAFLGCSTRRVRALLSQGRITGEKVGTEWRIQWPLQCTFGLRAPLRKFSQSGNIKKQSHPNHESEA